MLTHSRNPCIYTNQTWLYLKNISSTGKTNRQHVVVTRANSFQAATSSIIAATIAIASVAGAIEAPLDSEAFINIPQTLSGECSSVNDCRKPRIQRPKSRQAEKCTGKCVGTCIRGGDGAPGEGPLNIRRPIVVFKQGFRSRQYCLVECSDICNLIKDGDDGP